MTPPDHLMTGFSIGAMYSSLCGILSVRRLAFFPVIIICGIFAMLPDADAFRGVYSSTDIFVGHRGITHSVFFVLSTSLIFMILFLETRKIKNYCKTGVYSDAKRALRIDLFVLLIISGLSHLVMDLPQPPGVWKGIPLFFPLKNGDLYLKSGGWGMMGWYDYRITLILFISVLLSFFLLSASFILKRKAHIKIFLASCVIIISISAGVLIFENINHSTYKGNKEWNESQRIYLTGFPQNVRIITSAGRAFILRLINH